MIHLSRAAHAEWAAAERERTEALQEQDQGEDVAALRCHLLAAATHYERAAQHVEEEVPGE